MLTHAITLALALFGQAAQAQTNSAPPPGDPSQLSLAERAAASRKAAAERSDHQETRRPDGPPPLTPEQFGSIRGTQYVNDFFHFQIELGQQWQALSRERIANDEATARQYVNPGKHSSDYRALWVGDSAGRNVILSILPWPPGAPRDIDQLTDGMKRTALAQLKSAVDLKEYEERLPLGDSSHKFSAFRVMGSVRDTQIVQSQQFMVRDGFLLLLLVTGRSDQDVSEALGSLQSSLTWAGTDR